MGTSQVNFIGEVTKSRWKRVLVISCRVYQNTFTYEDNVIVHFRRAILRRYQRRTKSNITRGLHNHMASKAEERRQNSQTSVTKDLLPPIQVDADQTESTDEALLSIRLMYGLLLRLAVDLTVHSFNGRH